VELLEVELSDTGCASAAGASVTKTSAPQARDAATVSADWGRNCVVTELRVVVTDPSPLP
jgi:hypothetical protein